LRFTRTKAKANGFAGLELFTCAGFCLCETVISAKSKQSVHSTFQYYRILQIYNFSHREVE